ncbi:MAG: DNA polymerase III subunit gamma/tau C-terminal domain-containing protein, partial [Solimonas sp.]
AKARHLLNDERRAAIERALSVQLGAPVRVLIDVAIDEVHSPAQLALQRDALRQQEAEGAIFNDPVVRAFREQFGATIKPGSIHPLDS